MLPSHLSWFRSNIIKDAAIPQHLLLCHWFACMVQCTGKSFYFDHFQWWGTRLNCIVRVGMKHMSTNTYCRMLATILPWHQDLAVMFCPEIILSHLIWLLRMSPTSWWYLIKACQGPWSTQWHSQKFFEGLPNSLAHHTARLVQK